MTVQFFAAALGLAFFAALGFAAYNNFYNEEQPNINYNRRQQREREAPRNDQNIARTRRRRRRPVRPTNTSCEMPACRRQASALCYRCNFHMCSTCVPFGGIDNLCLRCEGDVQQFAECCIICTDQIFDCYLEPCMHLAHRDCMTQWCRRNNGNGQCGQCTERVQEHHIRTDFASRGTFEAY